MKPLLVIAGASGVIGQHFIQHASPSYRILKLTSKTGQTNLAQNNLAQDITLLTWNPKSAQQKDQASLNLLAQSLNGATAVINLSGSSIAEGRLGKKHQDEILESRLSSTATLVEACQRSDDAPQSFFQASAVGYYGNRGEETLDETSLAQTGNVLSDICVAWENAAQPIKQISRLVIGRFGLVIAKDAPAWQKLILPIKLFVGGPLGSGQQWYPWIDADDLARAILFLIEQKTSKGVYNLSAPQPIRQKELAKKTAHYLGRPSIIPAPTFALRLALGGVADALILPSAKVFPTRLEQAGFGFEFSSFETGLRKWLETTK